MAPDTLGSSRPGSATPPGRALLWGIGLAGLAAAAGMVVLAVGAEELYQPELRVVLIVWASLPYIFGGILAWHRRPDSRFGPLMIVAGFVTPLSTLQWADPPLPNTIGQFCDLLLPALWLHVFLAYPSGYLRDRLERAVVGAGYAAALGLQLVVLLLGGFSERNLLAVVRRPDLAEAVQNVQLIAISVLALAGAALLVARAHARHPLRQRRRARLLADAFALALVMTAGLLLAGAFELAWFEVIRLATFAAVGLAPVAFLAGLLDARLAQAGVGELLVRLRAEEFPDLRLLIARALRDPSLTLAYWLPQYRSWADRDGNPVTLPGDAPDGAADGRAVTVIERDGEQVAALVYDASLREEPALVAAVSAAAGIALENGRLEAELRAQLQELQGSRSRLVEATQQERQRLERDLHDGAQQRLVALALELGMLSERLDADPEARARVERARGEVAVSLEELRDLARGIHPAVVTGHGLTVALESLAARSPEPLELHADGVPRLPEQVEVAGYYVVCEGLANAGKHAKAGLVVVDVAVTDDVLVVQVSDDGVGGADTERGSGLRGLADRVEALGGRLRVWTPAGAGTRLRAEIPCG